MTEDVLLEVNNLTTDFVMKRGTVHAVIDVSFSVRMGEVLAIVGESGSGKSVTSLSVMGLLQPPGRVVAGEILYRGRDLLKLPANEMRDIRGNHISMIFQEPMTSLNPVFTVEDQLVESIRTHMKLHHKAAVERAIDMMRLVGIPSPEKRIKDYPHQMSGGMRQRVMVAMALSCDPDLLIADEPTTALDVTIQAQILALINDLRSKIGMAVLLITHDLGVVAETADRVVVMYCGQVVEEATALQIFERPMHPYTLGLLESIPTMEDTESDEALYMIPGMVPNPLNMPKGCAFAERCARRFDRCTREMPALYEAEERALRCFLFDPDAEGGALMTEPLMQLKHLSKFFPVDRDLLGRTTSVLKAVDDLSLDILPGEAFGLVGESGCGKTTVGKMLVDLYKPTAGEIWYDGRDITTLSARERRKLCCGIQLIFQDPYASLNPRMTVGQIISEPIRINHLVPRDQVDDRVAYLLNAVGLSANYRNRFPHEFSGGQRQRIGIARALAMEPRIIVCDEPVSALDVSIQAQVLNLLSDLRGEFGLTYLFIAHGLNVVKHISDRVGVMYLGRLVEVAPKRELYNNPLHPYTKALLSAIPVTNPAQRKKRILLEGDVPSPIDPPPGCRFAQRCYARAGCTSCACDTVMPELVEVSPGHFVSCYLFGAQ